VADGCAVAAGLGEALWPGVGVEVLVPHPVMIRAHNINPIRGMNNFFINAS
jgi:hypothetical protein